MVVGLVGAGSWYAFGRTKGGSTIPSALLHKVTRGEFSQEVVERGELSSSKNTEVRCDVKSRNTTGTAILQIVPEGTIVRKGDFLARLDSSTLETEKIQQQIVANTSKAVMIQSQNVHDLAVIARKQYLDGDYRALEETAQSAIFVAEETVRRSEQVHDFSKRMRSRGYTSAIQVEADRYSHEKAKMDLRVANTTLEVLQNYTKTKTLKQLENDIKTADAKFQADQSTHELDQSKLRDIEAQIANCEIVAPQDGQIVYANRRDRGDDDVVIEEGALLRERQVIFFMPDPTTMQVDAKINEARVGLVAVGQEVTVGVDALPDRTFRGRVIKVNEFPEPQRWSSNAKEYAATVEVVGTHPELRPGLTAQVKIHVERQPNMVQVPVQSVVERNGRRFCLKHTPAGLVPQEVAIGSASDKFVVITDGLSENELVAVNPRQLLPDMDLPELRDDRLLASNDKGGQPGGADKVVSDPAAKKAAEDKAAAETVTATNKPEANAGQ
jgi:multidrug efflux pump subunit AcrA (membrane-fusion protein)